MSKGLEALDKLRKYINPIYGKDLVQQYHDASESTNIIEKELKAFAILKEHIALNRAFDDLTKGNTEVVLVEIKALIPKEEYPLIREVLK